MSKNQKQREKLVQLLKELFQLNEPELDFGLYRIMHAKADEVTKFLEEDLLKIIGDAFGDADQIQVEKAQAAYDAARKQAQDFGLEGDAIDESVPVKKAQKGLDKIINADSQEGEVYEHLYRFFERYYDAGDFMSRRYFARETDAKAAPYSVPYDGREVYLHWANKDQYYIKSSEHLSHFTFHLSQSVDLPDGLRAMMGDEKLTVECRVVTGAEGEHDNVKPSDDIERNFILHDNAPVLLEEGFNGIPRLVLQFEYRPLPGNKYPMDEAREKELKSKYKARNKGDLPLLDMSDKVLAAIPVEAEIHKQALKAVVGTDTVKERPLLTKYLRKYMARNTMDYFIHKDLGGFMRRELDFYIKNEIMRLDDIDSANAEDVHSYLKRIQVLRRIGRPIIEFLAQLEEFQKKIWLKKKFVTETQYCITLDRISEEFYPEIAVNEAQRMEWVELFAIDELEGYSESLTVDFLKVNNRLLVDTAFLKIETKNEIIASLKNLDSNLGGQLSHSDNFQALRLLREKLSGSIKCIYIDPPYNTDSSSIPYKNNYKHSSWATLMHDRVGALRPLMPENGAIFVSIDKAERTVLEHVMDSVFGAKNRVEELIWSMNTNNSQVPNYSTNHEYVLVYAKNKNVANKERAMFREPKPGFLNVMELVESLNPSYPPISEVEAAIKKLYSEHKVTFREEIEAQGLEWDDFKKDDPWKGLFNYKRAEYRNSDGRLVKESEAKQISAKIWVWREDNLALPATKQAASTKKPDSENYRYYHPTHPVTKKPSSMPKSGWKFPYGSEGLDEDRMTLRKLSADHRIAWGTDESKVPQIKRMLHEVETNVGKSVFSDYSDGEKQTSALFGRSGVFLAPKHGDFVSRFIIHAAKGDTNILDCFGGSGSTGHAVISLNRADRGNRKFNLIEMGEYFDTVTKPRVLKALYASKWKDGKPVSRDGLSHAFKYIRLESYEDALNNLHLAISPDLATADSSFRRDYMLSYMLDFETKDSPSLLNINAFDDPDNYWMMIKKPGSEEAVETRIDLIETFNWLIGLHVEQIDAWRNYAADFAREIDPELPKDSETRLRVKDGLSSADNGEFGFRKITGFVLEEPGNTDTKRPVMVIWRKLTGDLEKDNAALETWFERERSHSYSFNFRDIYVNGSCNLENLKEPADKWRVHLLEEVFHKAMWDVEN